MHNGKHKIVINAWRGNRPLTHVHITANDCKRQTNASKKVFYSLPSAYGWTLRKTAIPSWKEETFPNSNNVSQQNLTSALSRMHLTRIYMHTIIARELSLANSHACFANNKVMSSVVWLTSADSSNLYIPSLTDQTRPWSKSSFKAILILAFRLW